MNRPERGARSRGGRPSDAATSVFRWPVRVYYEDTDAGGVVYHANALRFFERARTEWLRALGFEQDALREAYGVLFVVRAMSIEWRAPLRFNQSLIVDCEPLAMSRVQLRLRQSIAVADPSAPRERRAGDAVAAGALGPPAIAAEVTIAVVDAEQLVPVRLPRAVFDGLCDRVNR